MAAKKTHTATLRRGRVFWHEKTEYKNGVPVPVTKETVAYLREHAFDQVTIHDGDRKTVEPRQKFEFNEITDDDAGEASGDGGQPARKAPRARTR